MPDFIKKMSQGRGEKQIKNLSQNSPSKMVKNLHRGFSLVEVLVGVALILIISTGIYGAFTTVMSVISASRAKLVAMDLANERFELIRNLPYADVGIVGGIPNGKIVRAEAFERSGFDFQATTTIRNVDDPFDGRLGGTPGDTSPSDYRLVEIEIGCPNCKNFPPVFVNTHVAPKNLETASNNGALFVQVIDANGQPIAGANVNIRNNQVNPAINIDETTNDVGMLQIIDAPPGVNAYEITATKSGYTTDRTYAPGAVGNPNPSKPHATVTVLTVTQISFVVDKVSELNISSLTQNCVPVGGINFDIEGTKVIGTSPNILKYDSSFVTDGSGEKNLPNMEWDTYPITLTDTAYDLIGMNPLFPVTLTPDISQNVQMIVAPKDPSTLLVVVKDAVTKLPVASSTVQLTGSGYDETLVTDRGFVNQTDWHNGNGQATSTDMTRYFSSSNIEINNPAGEIKLTGSFGTYDTSGELVSSTFDTGISSNFHQLSWFPGDQPPEAGAESVRMQIATNNDETTWDFVGPGGPGTYYTSPTSDINPVHNGDRFLRYKILLGTEDIGFTPNVSSISFTYASQCVPPGQVVFSGLSSGGYTISVTHPNYEDQDVNINVGSSWQQQEVLMTPL